MKFLYIYVDVNLNCKKRTLNMICFQNLLNFCLIQSNYILLTFYDNDSILCVLNQSCSIVATFVLFYSLFLIGFKGNLFSKAFAKFYMFLGLFNVCNIELDTKGCCFTFFVCTLSLVCAHIYAHTCCCSYTSVAPLQVYHQAKKEHEVKSCKLFSSCTQHPTSTE